MKRLLAASAGLAALATLIGCASGGSSSSGSAVKATEFDYKGDSAVIGYFDFEGDIVDNEVPDTSAAELSVMTAALDGSKTVEGISKGKAGGKALSFDGKEEFITLDGNETLTGDGFTFAAWVKAPKWTTWARLVDLGDTKNDLFIAVDGRTAGTLVIREEGSQAQANAPLPTINEWAHIAGTFGNGKLKIYVDGELGGEVACGVKPAAIKASAQGLYVGKSNWPDPLFEGAMDNILIANRVLSAGEIAYLYQLDAPAKKEEAAVDAEPFVIDSSVVGYYTFDEGVTDNEVVDNSGKETNLYTGTIEKSEVVAGKNGKALKFNGDDEYITLEQDQISGDAITISMWINPTQWNAWCRVFDLGDQKSDLWLGMDGISGMLRVDCVGPDGNITLLGNLPKIGKWTHVAVTLGNGEVALYVNGRLAQKNGNSLTPAQISANATGLYIGRSNWPDPLFKGLMDDILIANRVFSAAEVASVYAGVKK